MNRILVGQNWKVFGTPILQIHRQSKVTIGDHLQLRSTYRSNPLGPNHPVIISTLNSKAVISIGHHFGISGGAIVCANAVIIGNHVTIGANTVISDTDFHPANPLLRQTNPQDGHTEPVTIGDNVFIGMNTLILKGVTIGAGSTVGAGSVVTHNIPPNVIAAGNPATVVRKLEHSSTQ